MRISILTPFLAAQRGNAITARRLAAGLAERGFRAEVYGFCDGVLPSAALAADVIHGFHAYHFGRVILPRLPAGAPLVLTLTGTDYNSDLFQPGRRPIVCAALARALQVVAFHRDAERQVAAAVPAVADKLQVIAPGVFLPDGGSPVTLPGVAAGDKVVLIVAGLRAVKNVPAAVEAVAALGRPDVKLIHAGPTLEVAVAAEIRRVGQKYPWFISLGEVAYEEIAALYRRAAVVVNTSLSEAIPGSILEAMFLGRPVVVADIPGNRAAVSHGRTGLVYRDQSELVRFLAILLDDEAAAAALGRRAARHVREHFSPARESAEYCRLYQAVPEKEG